MRRYLFSVFIGLIISSISAFGQTNACRIEIIRLKFDKNHQVKAGEVTDSILTLAKLTTSVLVGKSDIKDFDIKIDTVCCIYAGQMFVTSHHYLLTSKAVSQLSALDIPLCCGIPVAIYVDDKEVYRAMLWNVLSSFGNKSLTMTLIKDTLIVANQLPSVPDFRNNILISKSLLPACLLGKQKLTEGKRQLTSHWRIAGRDVHFISLLFAIGQ